MSECVPGLCSNQKHRTVISIASEVLHDQLFLLTSDSHNLFTVIIAIDIGRLDFARNGAIRHDDTASCSLKRSSKPIKWTVTARCRQNARAKLKFSYGPVRLLM